MRNNQSDIHRLAARNRVRVSEEMGVGIRVGGLVDMW
jgi:hypothetical protein